MVTLRDRSTIKRPLKLRDAAEGGAAASEVPATKRQKKAPPTTHGAGTSTASAKPKGSKARQAAGERSKKRNARAETLAKKAKSQGKKDDPSPALDAAPVATTTAAAANNTNGKGKKKPESKGRSKSKATEPDSGPATTTTTTTTTTTAAAKKADGKGKKKQPESKTKSKSTEPEAAPAAATTANGTRSKGEKKKPQGKAKSKSTEPKSAPAKAASANDAGNKGKKKAQPEAVSATVANTKSRGKKRKPEADTPEPKKEDNASAHREEAGKKQGRARKRQAVQDIRETDEQSSQQKDDPQPESEAGSAPAKSDNRRQASRKKAVEGVKTSRNGRKPLTEASDSSKAQPATKETELQPEEHKSARARSLTAEHSKTLDDGRGAETKRTKIILKMPAAPRSRWQRTPAVVPELPIAEPEVPELEDQAEPHRPLAAASPSPVSKPLDSRIAQSTGEAREEVGAEAEAGPAVAGSPSPAKKRKSSRLKARWPKATETAEEEEVPKLSAFAQAKLDSIRDFKVASFRGGAPGKPDPKLKLPPVKKNKPESAAEEVRRTETWARSFLQEQNEDESPAAADARYEILLEKAKMCPRSKLAARRFKARLRDWAIKNGIQPALADAAVDEEVELARGEQHAFLELTKETRKDLEKLDEE